MCRSRKQRAGATYCFYCVHNYDCEIYAFMYSVRFDSLSLPTHGDLVAPPSGSRLGGPGSLYSDIAGRVSHHDAHNGASEDSKSSVSALLLGRNGESTEDAFFSLSFVFAQGDLALTLRMGP